MYKDELLFLSKPSLLTIAPKIIFYIGIVVLFYFLEPFVNPILNSLAGLIADITSYSPISTHYNYSAFLSVIGIFLFLLTTYQVLKIINTKYFFLKDRIVFEYGILNKKKSYIEFFRIRDHGVERSLLARIFGKCDLTLYTTDKTHPYIKLKLINKFYKNEIQFRKAINDIVSESGRGREIDVV